MRMGNCVFPVFGLVAIGGCATPATNTFEYIESSPTEVQNEALIEDDFEAVWSRLVRQLATGFFVINNIEKESRLINVSFSSTNPEDYIDCGTTKRTFVQGKTLEELDYNVAADSAYKYGGGVDPSGTAALIGYAKRSTNLDGRINIYIAPIGESTEVTANVRYVLTIKTSAIENYEDSFGNITLTQPGPTDTVTISFNTNQPNRTEARISCFSKGVLEVEILGMAYSD